VGDTNPNPNPLVVLLSSDSLMKSYISSVYEKQLQLLNHASKTGFNQQPSKSQSQLKEGLLSVLVDEMVTSKSKSKQSTTMDSGDGDCTGIQAQLQPSSEVTLHHIVPFLLGYIGSNGSSGTGDWDPASDAVNESGRDLVGDTDMDTDTVVDKLIDIATHSNKIQYLTCCVGVLTALLHSSRSDIASKSGVLVTGSETGMDSMDNSGSIGGICTQYACLVGVLQAVQQFLTSNQKLLLTVCSSQVGVC